MASLCSTLLLVLSALYVAAADLQVWGIRGYGIKGDMLSKPDPYVKVYCGSTFGGMTEFKTSDPNPIWSTSFRFPDGKVGNFLKLELWDRDLLFDNRLGTCRAMVKQNTSAKVTCSMRKGELEFYYGL
ncbi:cytosolic phospholipase A2-like [Engraulis encrasicolus]|uniref:cytosolic phospholipase A2-like n=1 Tax=Engraulis encrasicolus TaxID=184585 RepID=UPI002FD6AC41